MKRIVAFPKDFDHDTYIFLSSFQGMRWRGDKQDRIRDSTEEQQYFIIADDNLLEGL